MERIMLGIIALTILLLFFPISTLNWLPNAVVGIAISLLFLSPLMDVASGKTDKYTVASLAVGVILYLLYTEYYFKGDFVQSAVFVLQWMATTCFISYITSMIVKRLERAIIR